METDNGSYTGDVNIMWQAPRHLEKGFSISQKKHMLKKLACSVITLMNCYMAIVFIFCVIGQAQTGAPSPGASPENTNANQARGWSVPPDNLPTNPPFVEDVSRKSAEPTKYGYLSEKEFIVTLIISVVSVITLLMQFLLLKKIPELKAEDTLRSFGVVLIIIGTLFFITAGFSSEQIAPAMGLFGTIAGYLLGRIEKKEDEKK